MKEEKREIKKEGRRRVVKWGVIPIESVWAQFV